MGMGVRGKGRGVRYSWGRGGWGPGCSRLPCQGPLGGAGLPGGRAGSQTALRSQHSLRPPRRPAPVAMGTSEAARLARGARLGLRRSRRVGWAESGPPPLSPPPRGRPEQRARVAEESAASGHPVPVPVQARVRGAAGGRAGGRGRGRGWLPGRGEQRDEAGPGRAACWHLLCAGRVGLPGPALRGPTCAHARGWVSARRQRSSDRVWASPGTRGGAGRRSHPDTRVPSSAGRAAM